MNEKKGNTKKHSKFRFFWVALGSLCLALGTVGIFLPILPTVPFYLATLFCYSRSSERLHDWFVGSTLYRKHLASFAEQRAMTMRTKWSIILTVTLVMGLGFLMMKRVPVARVILVIVWMAHLLYFFLRVKTLPAGESEKGDMS